MAGRKYHYPPVQVIAHRLPHRFRELLFIARFRIIFRNNVEPRLVRQSAVLVRSVIRGTSWRSAPFAFNHYGLHKGKYLKYCYSIVNELEGRICPSIIFAVGNGVLHNSFYQNRRFDEKISVVLYLIVENHNSFFSPNIFFNFLRILTFCE